ncbi:MAG: TerC family protein [Rhodocyclales bacterium]|nr:TerC family protein [Rhodocyclales bacterium]
MDILSQSAFWLGLAKIIWVNILLSGDNAVVIALAARSLQPAQQKYAVIWGSVAAIIMRVVLTVFAVQMLQWPWLKLVGAVLLVWVGVQLLEEEDEGADIKQSSSLLGAIKTILIADLIMSLDNVLAVAAAADGAPQEAKLALLIIGLGLSIPIVIFGSSVVLKLMGRFPVIITLGAMLLGWIAGEMLGTEQKFQNYVQVTSAVHYALAIGGALLVLGLARLRLFSTAKQAGS